MSPIWKQALVLLAFAAGVPPRAVTAPEDPPVKRFAAKDLAQDGERPDAACLVRPVAVAFDADRVYVVDAEDCAVKVFSKSGRFVAAFGRKGRGPGEFSFPSGLAVLGGRLFVADKLNHRLEVLDSAGRHVRSLALPFPPDRVLVLAADRILVTSSATGRPGGEMLHLLGGAGETLRETLTARTSGDPVLDAFLNMIAVVPGTEGDFYVAWKSQERCLLHFGRDGSLRERIAIDPRYASKTVCLPVKGGKKTIEAFVWDCAADRGRLYVLAPEYTGEGDIGPGDKVFVLDAGGRLEARIDLPDRVSRLAVDGDRLYAVDRAGELRILRVTR